MDNNLNLRLSFKFTISGAKPYALIIEQNFSENSKLGIGILMLLITRYVTLLTGR